jgi:protein-S-isoprenylcysteine O-methyltransferase Ste14
VGHSRSPRPDALICTAVCLFTGAGAAAHGSWTTAALGGLVLGSTLIPIFCEEKLVTARYPEYASYAARSWRMIPYVF